MTHCFVHLTPTVRNYLLAAGAVTTEDLAGWWAGLDEVEEDSLRLGWTEADRLGANFAWSEAKRPAVQRLPKVRVPGVVHTTQVPTPVLALPPGQGELSKESLAPVVSSAHPSTDRYRPILRQIYLDLGSSGRFWDDFDPETYFDFLARAALRLEPSTISSCLAGWSAWKEWWFGQAPRHDLP